MVSIATPVAMNDIEREENKCSAVDVWGGGGRLVEGFSADHKIATPISIPGFQQDAPRG